MRNLAILLFLALMLGTAQAQYNSVSASTNLAAARTLVKQSFPGDANLLTIITIRWQMTGFPEDLYINREGKAGMWGYIFYSPTSDVASVVVSLSDNGTVQMGQQSPMYAALGNDTTSLADGWVDSPVAMTELLKQQTGTFLDTKPGARIEALVLTPASPVPGTGGSWVCMTTTSTDTLQCAVSALTAEFLTCNSSTDVGVIPAAARFSIAPVWPSPIAAGMDARMDLTLEAPASVVVTIHDLMGREVGIAYDGMLPAGTTPIVIPRTALTLPGAYFIHVASGNDVATRKIIVTR